MQPVKFFQSIVYNCKITWVDSLESFFSFSIKLSFLIFFIVVVLHLAIVRMVGKSEVFCVTRVPHSCTYIVNFEQGFIVSLNG